MKKSKILIVDDDPAMKSSLVDWFEYIGDYQISSADCGEEALKKIGQERFDVVITNLKMPDINGLELLRQAKSLNADTEVIIMTAYGTADTEMDAKKHGAYDYILKPFSPEEVERIVRNIIDQHSP